MTACFKTPTRLAAAAALALTLGVGAGAAETDTVRMVITHKPGPAAMAMAKRAIAQAGGTIKVELSADNAIAVELPRSMLAKLQAQRNVAFTSVTEDAKRYPISTMFAVKPMAERIAEAAERPHLPNHPKPPKSSEVKPYGVSMVAVNGVPRADVSNRKVCIIDSGMDASHEDLERVPATGSNDKGSGDWRNDEVHHGTHVAGTIAAVKNRKGVVGVVANGDLSLHIVKVFSAKGWAYSSDLAAAAEECKAAGANVISMSLGGPIPMPSERKTFERLESEGILSIAAAGNDGNTMKSYPASYGGVMSVAALDEHKAWSSYSQRNSEVEISAPGTAVQSTVPMGTGVDAGLTVGATAVPSASGTDGSPLGDVTAPMADFGLGLNAAPGTMTGKVCLIQRGEATFGDKVLNCQKSGGKAAVIYNNESGPLGATLGDVVTAIPSVTTSDTDGAALVAKVGQPATVKVTASNYAYFSGTSMATPHVSAVAALVWSNFPGCTAKQIRAVLNGTAEDLDAPGRDVKTGYGLVQAKAAYDYLSANGCGN